MSATRDVLVPHWLTSSWSRILRAGSRCRSRWSAGSCCWSTWPYGWAEGSHPLQTVSTGSTGERRVDIQFYSIKNGAIIFHPAVRLSLTLKQKWFRGSFPSIPMNHTCMSYFNLLQLWLLPGFKVKCSVYELCLIIPSSVWVMFLSSTGQFILPEWFESLICQQMHERRLTWIAWSHESHKLLLTSASSSELLISDTNNWPRWSTIHSLHSQHL